MKRFKNQKIIPGGNIKMSKNYKEISESILQGIGGKENVVSAAHCATRLRLVLKDDKKADVLRKLIASYMHIKDFYYGIKYIDEYI